jgi:hypothetical protein
VASPQEFLIKLKIGTGAASPRWIISSLLPASAQIRVNILNIRREKMENSYRFPPKKPPINADLQLHLGVQLQRLFAETAHQPIPARFSDLLDQLQFGGNPDRAERAAPRRANGADVARMNEVK